jgi:membrane protease YdiL (CAAX protease family)
VALVLVGWVLAWLYRKRGMAAAMLAHGTVNAVAAAALIAQG